MRAGVGVISEGGGSEGGGGALCSSIGGSASTDPSVPEVAAVSDDSMCDTIPAIALQSSVSDGWLNEWRTVVHLPTFQSCSAPSSRS